MTWSVQIDGHDDLEAEAKAAFENGLVSMIRGVVADLKAGAGVTVTRANVTTNTTGSVDATADEAPADDTAPEEEAPPPA